MQNRRILAVFSDLKRSARNMQTKPTLAVLGFVFMWGAQAQATPITGNIGFTAPFRPLKSLSVRQFINIGTAHAVDIIGDTGTVTSATGDFATFLPTSSSVVYNDFDFDPFSAVSPLWSGGGFNFVLTSINVVTQGRFNLVLSGSGV